MINVLTLENLTVGYNKKPIVKEIVASVNSGELVCILGKNGAGKSTLINTILGFQPPLSGHLKIDDQSFLKLSPADKAKKIAVVLPKLHQVPAIKVRDILAMGRMPYHTSLSQLSPQDRDWINEVVEMVGISDLIEQYANQLSEGQLQLVMIARALCQDTPLIILDEPTSNLDLANQYKIFNLIKELKTKTGKSFLMITHEVHFALQFSDQIWWIENGSLSSGLPEQIAFDQAILPKLSGDYLTYNFIHGKYGNAQNWDKEIDVRGQSEYAYWVKQALGRHGFAISENATDVVEITENNIIFGDSKFETIIELLNYLLQHEKHNHHRSK